MYENKIHSEIVIEKILAKLGLVCLMYSMLHCKLTRNSRVSYPIVTSPYFEFWQVFHIKPPYLMALFVMDKGKHDYN